jgi:hypothetical protein
MESHLSRLTSSRIAIQYRRSTYVRRNAIAAREGDRYGRILAIAPRAV